MDRYSKFKKSLLLLLLINNHSFAESIEGYSLLAGDSTLCTGFSNYLNAYMDYSSVKEKSVSRFYGIRHKVGSVKLPNGKMSTPFQLDINNDGKDEIYFRYDGGGSYLLGTILYVINDPAKLPPDLSNIEVDDLQVFPCQYDKNPYASRDCPTFSQKADSAGALVSIGEESVFFRGRYTDIHNLRHKDINYLLFRSMSHNTKDYAAVIKPFDINSYESVCILKR